MLKDITGIRLEGANFASATDLQLFADENLQGSNNARISLLYGKNGSGKTTISKAFRKITDANEPALRIAVPIDASAQEVPLSEEECHHIHVFNETFIQNQVSLQTEGLETVVVLGAAIDVQKQLEEALERFNVLAEQRKTQKQIVSHLSDSTSKDSPKYCLYQIGNSLRGADGWAERDRLIRGTRQATRVFDNTYEQFLPLTPSKSREQLLEEFEDGLRRLEQAKSGELKILAIVPHSFQIPFDEESVLELLSKKLEEPILSDREKRLIELAKEHGTGYVQRIGKFASETSNRTCPFCLQAVSDDYKSQLYSSVEMVLNEDIKDHQRRLQEKRLSPLSVDFSPFSALDPQLLKDCNKALNALNGTIEQINNCVDQKILNVFSPIIVEPFCLAEKLQAFITAMSQLEELRLQHNRSVTDPKPIRTELESINADIASYDIKAPYARYIAQLEEYNSAKTAYESIDTEYQEVLVVIRQLQEKKKSVVIAKDLINRWLSFIFYSTDRISLESEGDKYFVRSAGKAVTPDKISTGERNSLALCYFFSTIMQEKEQEKIYDDPRLIIIDDPVSSFDVENCVGVLSFLKGQIQSYLLGNEETRVLLMTHDLQTFYNLQISSTEILPNCSEAAQNGVKYSCAYIELVDRQLIRFSFKNRNEYTALLTIVYDFAINGTDEKVISIGNIMRRVVEAYSSFMYKKKFELLTGGDLAKQDMNPVIAQYFEQSLHRLALNSSSHMKERANTMASMEFGSYLSKETLQQTARDMVCLLYSINNLHVKSHLNTFRNVEETINGWLDDIKQRTP